MRFARFVLLALSFAAGALIAQNVSVGPSEEAREALPLISEHAEPSHDAGPFR